MYDDDQESVKILFFSLSLLGYVSTKYDDDTLLVYHVIYIVECCI